MHVNLEPTESHEMQVLYGVNEGEDGVLTRGCLNVLADEGLKGREGTNRGYM